MKRIKALVSVIIFTFSFFCVGSMVVVAEGTVTAEQRNMYQKVFNYNYYATAYPDVVATVGNNSEALLDHYITHGIYEGRSASEFFNLSAYVKRYPVLLETFGTDFDAYIRYYTTQGAYEAQNASADDTYLTPSAAASIINRMNTLIGYCTTVYDPNIARATNVELAANNINGTVLQPGQQFSYSKTVGPRTRSRGFVEAPIFLGGKHGVGIGGGICQVSSTLYTAMVNAGIKPTERHEHSLPVAYLPAGFDATVSGDYYDLKFVNPYDFPIEIKATAQDGFLTIVILKAQ